MTTFFLTLYFRWLAKQAIKYVRHFSKGEKINVVKQITNIEIMQCID